MRRRLWSLDRAHGNRSKSLCKGADVDIPTVADSRRDPLSSLPIDISIKAKGSDQGYDSSRLSL